MMAADWGQLWRVAVVCVGVYAILLILLRVSGKRTLAKLNAFDLVVSVAFGSTVATTMLSPDVSLSEGAVALGALIASQYLVAVVSVRSPRARRLLKSAPTLLLSEGRMLPDALVQARITPEEVRQAVRGSGKGGLDLIAAVILETDGTLSVIGKDQRGSGDALADVSR